MNILFLEIDGVLKPSYAQNRFQFDVEKLKKELVKKNIADFSNINPYDIAAVCFDFVTLSVELLRLLLYKFDMKIVISSSWRISNFENEMMKNLLSLQNLDNYFYDNLPCYDDFSKAQEISLYLARNPQIKHFLVLDKIDENLRENFPKNSVFCRQMFSIENYLEAISLMSDRIDVEQNDFFQSPLPNDFFLKQIFEPKI